MPMRTRLDKLERLTHFYIKKEMCRLKKIEEKTRLLEQKKGSTNTNHTGFQLFVKMQAGNTITLDGITTETSIEAIKEAIEAKDGLPVEEQRLIFSGKQLEDGKIVGDYKIQKENTLHVVLSGIGGRLPDDILDEESIKQNLTHLIPLVKYWDYDLDGVSRITKDVRATIDEGLAQLQREGICLSESLDQLYLNVTDEAGWVFAIQTLEINDPKVLYSNPEDATATPNPEHLVFLQNIIDQTNTFFDEVAGSTYDVQIRMIFGDANLDIAKGKYANAQTSLNALWDKIDTDYHGDDAEIGTSGYASFNTKIHLAPVFFQDENEAFITLVHESLHLGNSDVLDIGGYHGSPMFEREQENVKLNNADHYAELARWSIGIGSETIFTPADLTGISSPPPTNCELAIDNTYTLFRQAWTVGLRLLGYFRDIYKAGWIGTDETAIVENFGTHRQAYSFISYWSPILNLPLAQHEYGHLAVTKLTLSLIEMITRRLSLAMNRCSISSEEVNSTLTSIDTMSIADLENLYIQETVTEVPLGLNSMENDIFLTRKMSALMGREMSNITLVSRGDLFNEMDDPTGDEAAFANNILNLYNVSESDDYIFKNITQNLIRILNITVDWVDSNFIVEDFLTRNFPFLLEDSLNELVQEDDPAINLILLRLLYIYKDSLIRYDWMLELYEHLSDENKQFVTDNIEVLRVAIEEESNKRNEKKRVREDDDYDNLGGQKKKKTTE